MRYCELFEQPTHIPISFNGNSLPINLSSVSQRCGETLVQVDVHKIDSAWRRDKDFYVGSGGEGGINGRYARFANFIKNAESIEASELVVSESGGVFFTNGRHRFAYLRDNGATVIPVAMDAESIRNAKKYGYIV